MNQKLKQNTNKRLGALFKTENDPSIAGLKPGPLANA